MIKMTQQEFDLIIAKAAPFSISGKYKDADFKVIQSFLTDKLKEAYELGRKTEREEGLAGLIEKCGKQWGNEYLISLHECKECWEALQEHKNWSKLRNYESGDEIVRFAEGSTPESAVKNLLQALKVKEETKQ